MITVGYFCSAGDTEIGGIHAFLEKMNSNILWKRCFPAVKKPDAKKKRADSILCDVHRGITGKSLIEQMLRCLRHPHFEWRQRFDLILMIDDMDCRFDGLDYTCITRWVLELNDRVSDSIGRKVDFDVLFASPEIEAWLISDWEFSFGKEYPRNVSYQLRMVIKDILDEYWGEIESYGGPYVNGSCANKLSEKIQMTLKSESFWRTFSDASHLDSQWSYSKRTNGGAMLKRIRPKEVEKNAGYILRQPLEG